MIDCEIPQYVWQRRSGRWALCLTFLQQKISWKKRVQVALETAQAVRTGTLLLMCYARLR